MCRFGVIVEFTHHPAVLHCSGDEDVATQGHRRPALSRALVSDCDVFVELGALTFADASLMLDLAMVARRLRRRGHAVRIREPQPQVWHLIETVGLHRLPGVVVEGPTPALA